MTTHYLHNDLVQIAFTLLPEEGKMLVTAMGRETMETDEHLMSVEEARRQYAALRDIGYVKGMAEQKINVQPIKEKLDNAARNGIKAPKMRVEGFCFTRAKDHSKNPGAIYVKAGPGYEDTYYGKITAEGDFSPSYDCTAEVKQRLAAIGADVVAAAKAYGRKTGQCSFCARQLTNKVSVALAYGPICAERYGLPHDYDETLLEEV